MISISNTIPKTEKLFLYFGRYENTTTVGYLCFSEPWEEYHLKDFKSLDNVHHDAFYLASIMDITNRFKNPITGLYDLSYEEYLKNVAKGHHIELLFRLEVEKTTHFTI